MKKLFALAVFALSISSTAFGASSEFERGFNEGKKVAVQSIKSGRIIMESGMYADIAVDHIGRLCDGTVVKVTCSRHNALAGVNCAGFCQE